MQLTQLLLHDGRLAQSHGVFDQLDFETIHFFWDSAIWLIVCVVFTRFAPGNRWLWIALVAASLHEVEHLYLYWIYHADPGFYVHGGLEGIMGNGGLIGSPFARPYLHFTYGLRVPRSDEARLRSPRHRSGRQARRGGSVVVRHGGPRGGCVAPPQADPSRPR